ncbi:similar to Saccharomyces cerevisiae YPL141C FRK1 Putative protein kinase [Maudiozyma barnettii]|uniref:non-specific serine/threonine protein kinase n=1 Tax=Maudiozyma barnettii TaxID=61262 RepID=A0A8H2VE53_9SACH|nr:uncharacterized protein KABA2_02S14696 [Kazachstania barnettii]CAB4253231.1 similar to Saccharomyces cerevisiae YPL141C FRK1 Putative protein kinase [Kazachstania barnettii]CAD1780233.1 similar to Saccharomyces cerevisiae YPL141C FRK1 Putative protein kinase [Kazachstania barnettii]
MISTSPHMPSHTSKSTSSAKSPTRQKKKHVTFGPYLIGATLGEGEFGKVKMAWTRPAKGSNDVSKQVAIKLIRRSSIIQNSEREIKVYREINALKHLTHPNIIGLEEVLQNSKYVGIVLEYASGGEFYKYIQKKRRLDEQRACKIFVELISGVTYMHSKGLVHRDLKLENLLLDSNENLLITDFGFVNEFRRDHELMRTSCGSPCYAAPELVVTTKPYMGRKADIWSCGIILFAMLAGYLPWDDDPSNPKGDDIPKLYHYITRTKLKFPSYVSAVPRDLLRKILVPDPKKRTDMTDIIQHPWLEPYFHLLCVSAKEWDRIMLQKKDNGKLKRNSTMVASSIANSSTTKNSCVVHETQKKRATSLIMDTTFKASVATQHTYQDEVLGGHTVHERKRLEPLIEEEKSKRNSSAASAALRAVVEKDEDSNLDIISKENNVVENLRSGEPFNISDRFASLPLSQHLDPTFDITNNENQDYIRAIDPKSLNKNTDHIIHTNKDQNSHHKPRPATYHLTLHSTTPDNFSTSGENLENQDDSKHTLVSENIHPVRSSSLVPDDITALTSYSKTNISQMSGIIKKNDVVVSNDTYPSSPVKNIRIRPSEISNNSSNNEHEALRSPIKDTYGSYQGINENIPMRNNLNNSTDEKDKKRFSFLSFYSSFNSSKTTMETEETSSTSVLSLSNHQRNNSHIRDRSGTTTSSYRTAVSTIPTLKGSQHSKQNVTDERSAIKKESTENSSGSTSRQAIRASVMVSSLSTRATPQIQERGNASNIPPHREVSKARKVLDFFKRRSMRI